MLALKSMPAGEEKKGRFSHRQHGQHPPQEGCILQLSLGHQQDLTAVFVSSTVPKKSQWQRQRDTQREPSAAEGQSHQGRPPYSGLATPTLGGSPGGRLREGVDTRIECIKTGGGLDIFQKVLRLLEERVPLSLGLPVRPNTRPAARPRGHSGAETHMVLLCLQACELAADAPVFPAAPNVTEASYPAFRQSVFDQLAFAEQVNPRAHGMFFAMIGGYPYFALLAR